MGDDLGVESYRAMLESCAIAASDSATCLILRGADALDWLNGQVTQEVSSLSPGELREACLCSVTGHIRSVMAVAVLKDKVVVTLPSVTSEVLIELVEASVFLEDVVVEKASDNWVSILVQGPSTPRVLAQLGIESPDGTFEIPDGRGLVQKLGVVGGGAMIWCEKNDPLLSALNREIPTAGEDLTNALRLELGYPRWGSDIAIKTLPPELGAKFLERTVSFSKGCYTGQEVLMRIRTRGHTNRSWMTLLCDEPVEAGSPVSSPLRENAGTVTSAAVSPDFGPIAGSMLHNDSAEPGTKVRVRSAGRTLHAEVRPVPLRD